MRKINSLMEKLGLTTRDEILAGDKQYKINKDGYCEDKDGGIDFNITSGILFGNIYYGILLGQISKEDYNMLYLLNRVGIKTIVKIDNNLYGSKLAKRVLEKKDLDKLIKKAPIDLESKSDLYKIPYYTDTLLIEFNSGVLYSTSFLLKRYKCVNLMI